MKKCTAKEATLCSKCENDRWTKKLGSNRRPLGAQKWGGNSGRSTTELCTQGRLEEKRNRRLRMSCGVACVALKDFLKIDGAAVITIDKLMAA